MVKGDLIELAVEACRRSTGLDVRRESKRASVETSGDEGLDCDGVVVIGEQPLMVKVRRTVDRVATVSYLSDNLGSLQTERGFAVGVLVTDYLSPEMLEQCRIQQLNAIDAAGNAYLSFDERYVLVSGRPRVLVHEQLGWSAAAIRLGLVALAQPATLGATQRNLATAAGIALGSVRSGLDWLVERRYVVESGTGPMVLQREQLLLEWENAYAARVRPKLDSERYAPERPLGRDWWKTMDIAFGVWSGEVGAQLLVGNLKPVTAQFYIPIDQRPPLRRRLFRELHLRNDPDGPIEILNKFWDLQTDDSSRVAPWPIVYADLLQTGDPRARETAMLIKDRFVDE